MNTIEQRLVAAIGTVDEFAEGRDNITFRPDRDVTLAMLKQIEALFGTDAINVNLAVRTPAVRWSTETKAKTPAA